MWGVRFADLISSFFTETKLFHIHRIFKNGGWEGSSSKPPEPPLDPPMLLPEKTNILNLSLYSM